MLQHERQSLLYKGSLFFFALSVLGLFLAEYAKAVPSIAMIGYIVCALLFLIVERKTAVHYPELLVFSGGIVLLYAAQYLYSDDLGYLNERVRIKLPLMLMPAAAAFLPVIKPKDLIRLGMIFLAVTSLTALLILVRFFSNYQYYLELISQSQVVPGPINHIRFSVICATAAGLSWYLLKRPELQTTRTIRIALYGVILLMLVFLHLYAVRSGIIALYGIAFLTIVREGLRSKNRKLKLVYLAAFVALPVFAYFASGSIRNKITATLNDVELYRSNHSNQFNSIGKRFVSYEMAFKVVQEHPLTGCGIGDLEQTNIALFHQYHPEISTIIIPHNQFIYFLMGSGIAGMLLFSFAFFYPLFYRRNYRNLLLLFLYAILFLSFQTEPMLETQLGVAFTVLMLLYALFWVRSGIADDTTSRIS